MFRLYSGLVRNGKWYNHAEIKPLHGGVISLLEGGDKTGAARILNLVKGSVSSLFDESGDEYKLEPIDYQQMKVVDTWKIGYEQIKLVTKKEYPIIPEYFFCSVCSTTGNERYTEVKESWQELIEKGYLVEYFQQEQDCRVELVLPDPIVIEGMKTVVGGTFDTLVISPLTIGEMLRIHHDSNAMSSEANQIYSSWDAQIVEIKGMGERDFNIIKRMPGEYFSKKYISTQDNLDALLQAIDKMKLGLDGAGRRVTCKYCGSEIGGCLDFTNFFLPLLPKK